MKRVWVLGAGGHAKVIVYTLRAAGEFHVEGLLDDNPEHWGREVLGAPVVTGITRDAVERLGIRYAIVGIGDNRARQRAVGLVGDLVSWVTAVHPSAFVGPGVCLGAGSLVVAGSLVQVDATIGKHVILNTGCSVGHDVTIGDLAHVGPGVRLAGHTHVGDGAFLGIGSCVVPAQHIGNWSIVGAGSVVIHDVPAGTTVAGSPARPIARRSQHSSTPAIPEVNAGSNQAETS